jgi:SAM-dependent methyltransferase
MTGAGDNWSDTARKWDALASPMKPHRDDTAVVERTAREAALGKQGLEVLVLGITKETIACDWPAGTRLRAVDSSPEMLSRLWPVPGAPQGATAALGDWLDLRLADGSIDLVAADGSLNVISHPKVARGLMAEVRRVLRPDGRFVVRTILRPEPLETVDEVLADLHAGRIGGPTALKVRVGATLHVPGPGGLSLHAMWKLWQRLFPDEEAEAARQGWPVELFRMVSDYARNDMRLVYPTLDELRALTAPHFDELDCAFGSYELAERAPTLVLAPR